MKKIAITGSGGFLGFHLRASALEHDAEILPIGVGDKFDEHDAKEKLCNAEVLIHIAGVNRGTDQEVYDGNLKFAAQIGSLISSSESNLKRIVFANSIQAGNGSVYGKAKQESAEFLSSIAKQRGVEFDDVLLPNLFGEFGRPFYNSVVATFAYQIANGQIPEVQNDKKLELLHAQDAADLLLGEINRSASRDLITGIHVSEVKDLLIEFSEVYKRGEFPDLSSRFRRDLFNTYRSFLFPDQAPVDVVRHADQRGSFFEIVRSNGGTGQTSFSTTVPGITRGDHFHRRKVERFTVLAGNAEISLRKIFTDEIFRFQISGENPVSIDMPTFYTHKIMNVGEEVLYTAFWTNDIFNPTNPDTIGEAV